MDHVVASDRRSAKPGSIVFDLDGVLYLDTAGVAGAAQALERLAAAGVEFVFATNNSTKTPAMVVDHLRERTGYVADVERVVTSGMATAWHLAPDSPRVFVLGPSAISESLRAAGIEHTTDWRDATAVVVGLDLDLNYRRLADAVLAVRNGARLVATNTDSTYPTPEGLYPGGGAIVAAVSEATGVAPEICGKPHRPMRALIRSKVGAGPVAVVGDRPETDLEIGTREGWRRILVLTGVTDAADVTARAAADVVLESVADLPAAILA